MHAARTILGALSFAMAWHGTPASAGGETTLACGYAMTMTLPGGADEARARLRIERREGIPAASHLYVIALDDTEARLVATAPAEHDVTVPATLVTLCAQEPIPWLSATPSGAPIAAQFRARLAALAEQDWRLKPKGLGPEIHRPDYEGFQVARSPDTPRLRAYVFTLKAR